MVAVQEEGNQLLCIAKTDDSTGKVEAATVKEALDNWGISDGIIASCFDTTSSNTGIYSGSTVLLQQQLLWLSCCHHIPELILKAAFQTLFGKTTGPSAALFSYLKTSWKSLDLTDLRLPPTHASCRSSVDAFLHFLDERLLPENKEHLTRGDYKELLELAKICLGGTVERKRNYTYQLSKPGADSNARWMAKCLYVLKLSLLQHQIPSLTEQTKKKINTMSPSLTGTASNDLKMYQDLNSFKRVSKAVSDACLPVLQRHTWYLTEECIPIALCNPALETETCNQLARDIGGLPPTSIQIRKPTLPSITSSSTLPDFVGPRSVLLFSQLKLDHTFLLAENWRETLHFYTLKSAISNLHPANDSSERALAMATSFNWRITRDEESYQDMMLVVAAHRKKYGFKTKEDLKNFVLILFDRLC